MAHTAPEPTADIDVAKARLTGARSQKAFSALLDALARPGTVGSIEPVALPAGLPTALVLPLALADVEVTVAVVTDGGNQWQRLIGDVTGARHAEPESASMVAFLDRVDAQLIRRLRRGTDGSPEGGAKVVIACGSLRHHDTGTAAVDEVVIDLRGPGVDRARRLAVGGLHAAVLDAIADANRGFPAGIDTWLVAPDGAIAAISRSTRLDLADLTEVP